MGFMDVVFTWPSAGLSPIQHLRRVRGLGFREVWVLSMV